MCVVELDSIVLGNGLPHVASFTKEVNLRLAKRPLKTNGRLANHRLTSLVKEATDRRQTITWTNTGLLATGPLGTHFSDIRIKILNFSFKKLHMKMFSSKWRPLKLKD